MSTIPFHTQTVQMTYDQFVTNFSLTERKCYIDLTEYCTQHFLTLGKNKGQATHNHQTQMNKAYQNIKQFIFETFGIQLIGKQNRNIHVCHACQCASNTQHPCINPKHLYIGTRTENFADKSAYNRSAFLRKALQNGNHVTQQTHHCQWCQKDFKGRCFYRWHGDNCKLNPASPRFKF